VNRRLLWIAGGLAGLSLAVVLAMSIANEEPLDTSIGFGEVTVEGPSLPPLADPSADLALGMTAPTLTGADWKSASYAIGPDGRPKIIVFLAHWCSHCRAEVPVVQSWLAAGNLPDGVDIYSVTTSTDPLLPNWPPQDWLEDEGWTVPVIMDDESGSAAHGYGMTGTPFYVVLNGDNVTVQRAAGEIGPIGLQELARIAAGS
jgi:cytochrome c biogenesis protein CcmG, thiol:disulfide interchange protein DsbE